MRPYHLAVVLLGEALLGCEGCARPTSSSGPTATIDAGVLEDAGPGDGSVEAGRGDATCSSTFQPMPGCVPPPVARACVDGWCRIPRGCFVMGSPLCQFGRGLYNEDENQVTLTHDFEIQEKEMTQAEWMRRGFPNPSKMAIGYGDCLSPDCPVGNITWFDAVAVANRLSTLHVPQLPECYRLVDCTGTAGDGLVCATVEQTTASLYDCAGYRLPTEAEWEYAARAGTRTPFYSGDFRSTAGDTLACDAELDLARVAWYCANAADFMTRAVGGRTPNGWGLFDMLGNASEWVSDEYDSHGYGTTPREDPGAILGTSELRILRGGSVSRPASVCTASRRGGMSRVLTRGPTGGVRLARTLAPVDAGAGR